MDRRGFQDLLLNLLAEAEIEGHPYPELVAVERFMRTHARFGEPSEDT